MFHSAETVKAKAQADGVIPIVPGQYLICTDTGDIFYDDKDGIRRHLTDVIDVATEAARKAILAPLNKFYFVQETRRFWRCVDGEWVDLSGQGGCTAVHTALTADGWSGGKQSIQISGLQAEGNGVISLANTVVGDAKAAAEAANLRIDSQADGTLTIAADGTVPTVDLAVVILLL